MSRLSLVLPRPATGASGARLGMPGLRRARGLLLPLVLALAWEGAARQGWLNTHLLPAPSELASAARGLMISGALWHHVVVSSLRVLSGFGMAILLAIPAGTAVGLSRRIEGLFDPSLQALRAIPSLAWVPLLLLWLGIDEAPKITLIAIGAFFPIYLNTVAGVRGVDRKLVEVGQISGLKGLEMWWRIFLPAALPNVLTGLRLGLSLGWMFLVAAELMASSAGLGYLLTDGRETGRTDLMLVAILVLALLGKLSDSLLRALEQHLLAWRDTFSSGHAPS